MNKGRKRVNISLIALSLALTLWAAWICRQPSPSHTETARAETLPPDSDANPTATTPDIISAMTEDKSPADSIHDTAPTTAYTATENPGHHEAPDRDTPARVASPVTTTRIQDADVRYMTGASHPFGMEARKVLSGDLEESDSLSRRRILSYCEHLRTSYTTRDIDFLRQTFSDNALIIVGHTIRPSDASSPKGTPKTAYSIRSKREYLERLSKIFDSGKDISLKFSDFRIMRHPTMEGIYGVTLRQRYECGGYSDDGWLFLLWDFRNPSMPLIHVRTWQPARSLSGEDDIIDMSDFNLE